MVAALVLTAMIGLAWTGANSLEHVLLSSRFARRCATMTILLWLESAVAFALWECVR